VNSSLGRPTSGEAGRAETGSRIDATTNPTRPATTARGRRRFHMAARRQKGPGVRTLFLAIDYQKSTGVR
jgi:hypothetical protein